VDGSNRVKPDILAPGEEVISSFPGNSYAIEQGTSMAGPHVVGTVALMWSANPKLIGDVDRTTSILIETAKPYQEQVDACGRSGSVPNNATGYGIVDAYAAVKAALAAQ
jgi:subtilisin family serine protease